MVPILGINYLLVPIRPEGSLLEDAYAILVALFSAFQGFFVSLLLCFTNAEVHLQIRRKWKRFLNGATYNSHLSIASSIRRKRSSYRREEMNKSCKVEETKKKESNMSNTKESIESEKMDLK